MSVGPAETVEAATGCHPFHCHRQFAMPEGGGIMESRIHSLVQWLEDKLEETGAAGFRSDFPAASIPRWWAI